MGGDETRSGYVQCVQGIQPNILARTMLNRGVLERENKEGGDPSGKVRVCLWF